MLDALTATTSNAALALVPVMDGVASLPLSTLDCQQLQQLSNTPVQQQPKSPIHSVPVNLTIQAINPTTAEDRYPMRYTLGSERGNRRIILVLSIPSSTSTTTRA
ncbi:hypothetical protein DFH27DRAFT_655526 [Peziza echinospora]|nr:hypothetical protein DFH27DRAFT_655526 [Peziza echinospora]